MSSMAKLYSNGHKVWSIEHHAHKGLNHLETEGNFPYSYDELRTKYGLDQDDPHIDYCYETPIGVANNVLEINPVALIFEQDALEKITLATRTVKTNVLSSSEPLQESFISTVVDELKSVETMDWFVVMGITIFVSIITGLGIAKLSAPTEIIKVAMSLVSIGMPYLYFNKVRGADKRVAITCSLAIFVAYQVVFFIRS